VSAVRLERLAGDLAEMSRIRGPRIEWLAEGGPPASAYVVTYHLPSYTSPAFTRREQHRVRFEMGPHYPFERPQALMLDTPPVFHPNVFADGRICFGVWSPEEGLAFLVIRVGRMLVYEPRLTNPGHPACLEAAEWYRANPGRFPVLRRVAFPDPLTGISLDPRPLRRIDLKVVIKR
jgi:ubiquitin-protein ligase